MINEHSEIKSHAENALGLLRESNKKDPLLAKYIDLYCLFIEAVEGGNSSIIRSRFIQIKSLSRLYLEKSSSWGEVFLEEMYIVEKLGRRQILNKEL
jgi:hypothetical protein